jgi:hypothetical protein
VRLTHCAASVSTSGTKVVFHHHEKQKALLSEKAIQGTLYNTRVAALSESATIYEAAGVIPRRILLPRKNICLKSFVLRLQWLA